jgi:hypothetical protein
MSGEKRGVRAAPNQFFSHFSLLLTHFSKYSRYHSTKRATPPSIEVFGA